MKWKGDIIKKKQRVEGARTLAPMVTDRYIDTDDHFVLYNRPPIIIQ